MHIEKEKNRFNSFPLNDYDDFLVSNDGNDILCDEMNECEGKIYEYIQIW